MNAGGVLGSMCFPSFPGFSGRLFAGRRRQGPRPRRRCGPTTTGTSTSGAAPTPAASSRWRSRVLWDPELAARRRCAASRPRAATRSPSPRTRRRSATRASTTTYWDPLWEACSRRGRRAVDPPRLVGPARGDRARRADRRDDHAPADEHLPGGGRPPVVAGPQGVPRPAHRALRGRHRLDPVLPRPARPHLRHAPPLDRPGLRRPAAERGLPRALPHLLHRRPGRASSSATRSASTTSAGSATTRTPTRRGPRPPRSCAGSAPPPACPTTSSTRSRTRTPCAGTRSTRSPTGPRSDCTVGALRAEAGDHDVSIRSYDKGRFEITHTGADLGKLAEDATA